jgi:hypothetical protein
MSEHGAERDAGLYATTASIVRSPLRRPDDEIRPWRPEDGDSRCQECERTYVPWFTDNWLWNHVMGGPNCTSDPGGYLCPRCFMVRVEQVSPGLVWRLFPEWSPSRVTPPTEGRP